MDLHYTLNQSVQGLIKADEQFNFANFVPHATIGEQIPDDVFPNVKASLSKLDIHFECRITSFTLFAEGEGGVWRPDEVFSLNIV